MTQIELAAEELKEAQLQIVEASLRTQAAAAVKHRLMGLSCLILSAGTFLWLLLHGIAAVRS